MAHPVVPGGVQPKPDAAFGQHMPDDVAAILRREYGQSRGSSIKACTFCRESYSIFPNEPSRKEYQEMSGICPCCWEVHFWDDVNKFEAANKILEFYGRRLLGHMKWQCLRCKVIVEGAELEKPHVCQLQDVTQNVSLDKDKPLPASELDRVIDVIPAGDGVVVKVIKRQGFGDTQPHLGDFVHIHYVCNQCGTKFDSSRDRGEEFGLVLGQGVVPGWDIGIATMKKGELCDLICAPHFASSNHTGSLPKTPPSEYETVTFEVELLSWEEAEDITPGLDKSLTRRVLLEGDDKYGKPDEDAVIEAHVKGVYAGRTFVDGDFKFSLGECTEHGLPGGIDEALTLFRRGETSFITLPPCWGYGNTGNAIFGIPPNATLGLEVHLKDFAKAKEACELSDDEKLSASDIIKARGNEYYGVSDEPTLNEDSPKSKGQYKLATAKYKKVLDLLQSETAWKNDKKTKRDQLYNAARLNLVACYLKLGDTGACIDYANNILGDDRDNVKALFRRGMAFKQEQRFGSAIMDFSRVLELDKNNSAATEALQQCRKMKAQRTVFGLVEDCVYADLLPSDQAVKHEWGFENCKSLQEEEKLLGLYIGLVMYLEVDVLDLEAWWESGTLVENIKTTFAKESNPGGYFPWFLQNQHILQNLTKYGG